MIKSFITIMILTYSLSCLAKEQLSTIPISDTGWLGADAAYSLLIAKDQRIWLFGDSFIGDLKDKKRVNGKIIKNSVGIERNKKFNFFWKKEAGGFFRNQRNNEWYWPGDLFTYKNKLFIFLRRIKKIRDSDPLGFQEIGNDLAVVDNYQDEPNECKFEIRPLLYEDITLGVATAIENSYLYMLVDDRSKEHQLYLARVKLSDLDSSNFELNFYNSETKNWAPKLPTRPLIKEGASEASLTYVNVLKKWRIILTPKGLSQKVVSYEATSLTAAWSEAKQVFNCPEMKKNKNYFCYAAKEVDTNGNQFIFSYNVNSWDFWDLSKDSSIYIPRIIEKENK